jgi:hypothetical protein
LTSVTPGSSSARRCASRASIRFLTYAHTFWVSAAWRRRARFRGGSWDAWGFSQCPARGSREASERKNRGRRTRGGRLVRFVRLRFPRTRTEPDRHIHTLSVTMVILSEALFAT